MVGVPGRLVYDMEEEDDVFGVNMGNVGNAMAREDGKRRRTSSRAQGSRLNAGANPWTGAGDLVYRGTTEGTGGRATGLVGSPAIALLPQTEVPHFSENPAEYRTFKRAFEVRMIRHCYDDRDRIDCLLQCLSGEAKDLIDDEWGAPLTYDEAMARLDRE